MKYVCEIELPDHPTHTQKLDAMVRASKDQSLWRAVQSKEELKKRTNLDGKCGTCKFFHPIERLLGSTCYGRCDKGLAVRQRSVKACHRYVKEEE